MDIAPPPMPAVRGPRRSLGFSDEPLAHDDPPPEWSVRRDASFEAYNASSQGAIEGAFQEGAVYAQITVPPFEYLIEFGPPHRQVRMDDASKVREVRRSPNIAQPHRQEEGGAGASGGGAGASASGVGGADGAGVIDVSDYGSLPGGYFSGGDHVGKVIKGNFVRHRPTHFMFASSGWPTDHRAAATKLGHMTKVIPVR
jgi:hypothetical protein